jgi:hypothetical protein
LLKRLLVALRRLNHAELSSRGVSAAWLRGVASIARANTGASAVIDLPG